MRNFLIIAALILGSCQGGSQNASKDAKAVSATAVETSIAVPTVKCNSCVKTVTKALTAIEGVEDVRLDKDTKVALVRYDASKLKVADLERAISMAGYDANDIRRDPKAYDNLDECCK